MKNIFTTSTTFIKTHYILSTVGALLVAFVVYKSFFAGSHTGEVYTVVRGDIGEQVLVTGKTKAVETVDLGFENSGRISAVYVDVGTKVSIGQTLATIDQSESSANLLKAQANLAAAQAQLDSLNVGTRPEELAIAESNVTSAKTSVTDAANDLSLKMTDAFTKSNDAIHNNVDALFSNARTSSPQINLAGLDTQLRNDINAMRFQVETVLTNWQSISTDTSDTSVTTAKANLQLIGSFIDKVALAINSQSGSGSLSQTSIDTYKASVSTARSNVSTAASNLTSSVDKYNSSQAALVVAQQTLDLRKNGNTKETIAAQQAVVLQNKAAVAAAQAQLGKTAIYSPLSGVVTKNDATVGSIVTPGKTIISVISDSNLQIESLVSEIHIGKISVGNPVDITFDAFPGKVYAGTVSYIDPAETLVDGIVNYKVTISLSQKYDELKSGLTANLTIKTKTVSGVLRVPEYALVHDGDKTYVMKKQGNKWVKTEVTLGVQGGDAYHEVVSGVAEGDILQYTAATK